jgi:Serine dehydrogenase proteinase
MPWSTLGGSVYMALFKKRGEMQQGQDIALLLDSPGGFAAVAFKLAKFLRHHCGGFTVVIPSFAKSAATLLALGANRIVLGEHAELGPLDAQETDIEEGQQRSVLNTVQSLERLNAFALRSFDETVQLLLRRSGFKMKTVLPYAIRFVGNLMRPLMANVDVVRYAETSRILKSTEDYAIRLLKPRYSDFETAEIARKLVGTYSDHGFAIDKDELKELGLKFELASGRIADIIASVRPFVDEVTAIGRIAEVTP